MDDRTYKAHLDGYNQTNLMTGKGPPQRHEIFYLTEGPLAAARIEDYKYRFTDQPNRWLGATVNVDWPILVNLRLDPFERTAFPTGNVDPLPIQLDRVRVLVLRIRAAGGGQGCPELNRVSADAKGCLAQYGRSESADPETSEVTLWRMKANNISEHPAERVLGFFRELVHENPILNDCGN